MEIRKTDSKGRLTGFDPETHYFVTGPLEGRYQIREVPVVDVIPEGYEPAEVVDLKNEILDALYDVGMDSEANDLIELSGRLGDALSKTVLRSC